MFYLICSFFHFCINIISVAVKGLHIYTKTKRSSLPPSPFSWPIVGNLPQVYLNKPPYKWINEQVKKLKTDIACFHLGKVHVMVVISPELAREFLHKHDSLFVSRPITMATEYSSRGFLTMGVSPYGEQSKKMRRMVTHELLSPMRLRWLHEKRNEETDNLLYYVFKRCNNPEGSVINLRVPLQHYSVNVIRKMTFGRRFFGQGGENGGPGFEEEEHVHALHSVLSHMYAFWVADYVPSLRFLDIDGHETTVRDSMGVFDKYHDPIIEQRIKQWKDGTKEKPEDFLDIMITLKDDKGDLLLSIEEIKAQCSEFLFGVDGPPAGAEWALAEMINQPEILQKAVDEVDNVVGRDRLVQESDVPQLNYLKACAREAFRLHPHAPYNLPHVSLQDVNVGGYHIPKGSHILLSRIGLGHNPQVWDEPLKFKPERHFGDQNGSTRVELTEPNLRFVTFSTGKRGCIGSYLGTLLTIMALARLIQGFTWSIPPNEEKIDLATSQELILAKPLRAHAKPRLDGTMYLRQ